MFVVVAIIFVSWDAVAVIAADMKHETVGVVVASIAAVVVLF